MHACMLVEEKYAPWPCTGSAINSIKLILRCGACKVKLSEDDAFLLCGAQSNYLRMMHSYFALVQVTKHQCIHMASLHLFSCHMVKHVTAAIHNLNGHGWILWNFISDKM